ncbi:hypothetical protein A2U01_0070722 [Trifolium medium]|uniref:Uncharacterized protein n=1 Tax=Trifolium medium TaxID=97028 RepID=A0A392SKR5_9FABA|nr:hypothetical protein [Trifolium medium]
MARCAVDDEEVWSSSVNCAPRRRGWRVALVCWKDASVTLGCWRVAQLHPARRAPS